MKPERFIVQVTGEELNVQYLLDHLKTKFGELYECGIMNG